jgi:leucyl aminopeptidase
LLQELGEKSGDYVWPLPLWDEYEADIKGNMGDWANIKSQGGNSRSGGVITAAMFLYQFAKKFPKWIHIDMAPRDAAVYDEFLAKGSSGSPIRLLVKLLDEYK